MKILRSLIKQKPFSRFAPMFVRLDAFVLCLQHHQSSKAAMTMLRQATCFGAQQTLAALSAVNAQPDVERERARLLGRMDLLRDRGPYEWTWTVSAAAAISKSPKQAGLLGAMVREFAPQQVIELGTNVGISAAYMALATKGKVVTLEASPARMELARELHRNLGLGNVEYVEGYFNDTLSQQLDRMPFVDFAFIDGQHEYQATKDYCAAILPHVKPGAVIFFDDIRFSSGMWRAWSEMSADNRFGLVLDFWTMGACVVRKGSEQKVTVSAVACF